jgi:hypothetical protein
LRGFAIKDWSEKPDPQGNANQKRQGGSKQNMLKIKNYIIYALQPKPMLFAFPKNQVGEVNPDF